MLMYLTKFSMLNNRWESMMKYVSRKFGCILLYHIFTSFPYIHINKKIRTSSLSLLYSLLLRHFAWFSQLYLRDGNRIITLMIYNVDKQSNKIKTALALHDGAVISIDFKSGTNRM